MLPNLSQMRLHDFSARGATRVNLAMQTAASRELLASTSRDVDVGPPAGNKRVLEDGEDANYQRMQSYYVCTQEEEPVLHVVRGWFRGQNRFVFEAMQSAAQFGYVLDVNDFSCLFKGAREPFETALAWYTSFFPDLSVFATSQRAQPDIERVRKKVPVSMQASLAKIGDESGHAFATAFADEFEALRRKHAHIVRGELSALTKYRVPAESDSYVVFAGPHMVESTRVKRLILYVHSETNVSAEIQLKKHRPNPKSSSRAVKLGLEDSVRSMVIPPSAQGNGRSNYVDQFLKEANGGVWGWPLPDGQESSSEAEAAAAPSCPEAVRPLLMFGQQSVDKAPSVPDLTVAQQQLVDRVRRSVIDDSSYVHKHVLRDAGTAVDGVSLSAADLEQYVLNNLAIVVNKGREMHARLCKELMGKLEQHRESRSEQLEDTLGWLLDPSDSSGTSGQNSVPSLLKRRLVEGLGVQKDSELFNFATNVLVRGARKTSSAAWQRLAGQTNFAWPEDANPRAKYFKDVADVTAELEDRWPDDQPFDVRQTPLVHEGGDTAKGVDMWQFVFNISAQKEAVELRKRLFDERRIPHPHLGIWVSENMPWCPPLSTPVGNFQNVYLLLTKGMFDAHYDPRHNYLRAALLPVIQAAWKAFSKQPFRTVLFSPERMNIRYLPTGGQKLNWHVDHDAIEAVCAPLAATEATEPADSSAQAPGFSTQEPQSGAFLADAQSATPAPSGSWAGVGEPPSYDEVKSMFERTSSDSMYCKGVRFSDDAKHASLSKICRLRVGSELTPDEFKSEVARAEHAADIGIGPKVFDSFVVKPATNVQGAEHASFGLLRMRRFEQDESFRKQLEVIERKLDADAAHVADSYSRAAALNALRDMGLALQRTLWNMWEHADFVHMDLHADNIFYSGGKVFFIDYGLCVPKLKLQEATKTNPYEWKARSVFLYGIQSAFEESAFDITSTLDGVPAFADVSQDIKQLFATFPTKPPE